MDHLPLVLVLAAFVLHVLGERRAVALTGRPRDRAARQRALMFYAALAVIVVALESPLDSLSDQLFWVHMIQHLLLLVVAAPLIVLARPWMSIWRPLPLSLRRAVARTAVRSRWFAPLRALAHLVTQPVAAWLIFNVNLVLWHMPGPYDATLESTSVHVLEHTTFLVFAILFWAQVAACPPARTRLSYGQRIAYLAAAAIPNIGLSMFLAYAQHPLYSHYAALAHRPGGISALTDQEIGAGFMWTAGDLPFAIAIGVLAQRWLDSHAERPARIGTPLT
jgi:putative membrane protein